MSQPPPVVVLGINTPTSMKATWATVWVASIGLWAFKISPLKFSSLGTAALLFLGLLLPIVIVGSFLKLVSVWRYAARLEGSVLVVQGALRARRCDLGSASQVSVSPWPGDKASLVARDGNTGQVVGLGLRQWDGVTNNLIPARDLNALADALASGSAAERHQVAIAALRRYANERKDSPGRYRPKPKSPGAR